jgi:hypothetical protein
MSDPAEIVDLVVRRQRNMRGHPEALASLPDDNGELVELALGTIDICRSDAGMRTNYYRQMDLAVETGSTAGGTRSLVNLQFRILDRLAAHLFSPTDVRFSIDYENPYGKRELDRGETAARLVSRSWEQTNTDLMFARGVFGALKYGSVFLKQWAGTEGKDRTPVYRSALLMPWQFGVYKPDSNSLQDQPALVETVPLTLPEVWRRIWQFPDARNLYERVKQHAAPGNGSETGNSFFHQVLSTSPIQTGAASGARTIPGGTVQITSDSAVLGVSPSYDAPRVLLHEMWIWDGSDYTMVQLIEPDILITRFKRDNGILPGMGSGLHPYTLIQPNEAEGNIWGRSELADLIEPQRFLTETATDIRRLFGVQVDKFLGVTGDGLTDETYDAARLAGYINLGAAGSVTDLTPKFPPESLPLIDKIVGLMETISGFDNMLSGRGETGVRSGAQSNPMMRAAGAPLKDRSLLVERQCAEAADKRLSLMEAKDGRTYWTDPKKPQETSFLLSDLPEDRRIVVDGHSTSPVFADEHQNLIIGGVKMGFIDGESAIEQLPFQNKDILLSRLRAKQEAAVAQMEQLRRENPEEWGRIMEKQASGGRRR